MDTLVRLFSIRKYYRRVRALDDVSLTIEPGITGLLGPNGAGKSTLIKVILGLVRVNAGSGQVLGYRIGRQARKIRTRVGYMSEDDSYVSGLLGVEMVQFVAQLHGLPRIEAMRRAHEILDFCGIEQERYRPVETYSTGMRQKLKFAQAIVHDPPFLILDEPTSGLDPEERQLMLHRIRNLARKGGKSVLLSTHILPDVQEISDTVVILVKGKIRLVDNMENLNKPAVPAFHIRVVGEAGRLAEIMRGHGLNVTDEGNRRLTVTCADEAIIPDLWAWAKESGVGIQEFAPAINSLEQIFIEAVEEGSHAHS